MRVDIMTGKVSCKCKSCGRTFSISSGEFIRSSMSAKTTCPKCRKKGGKK